MNYFFFSFCLIFILLLQIAQPDLQSISFSIHFNSHSSMSSNYPSIHLCNTSINASNFSSFHLFISSTLHHSIHPITSSIFITARVGVWVRERVMEYFKSIFHQHLNWLNFIVFMTVQNWNILWLIFILLSYFTIHVYNIFFIFKSIFPSLFLFTNDWMVYCIHPCFRTCNSTILSFTTSTLYGTYLALLSHTSTSTSTFIILFSIVSTFVTYVIF